jgi:hypothetical protein
MYRLLGSLVLGVGLLTPIQTLSAQDHHDQVEKAHQWNDGENDAWHRYLKERHKKDHDWEKASKKEQAAYWKWRDSHPDHH